MEDLEWSFRSSESAGIEEEEEEEVEKRWMREGLDSVRRLGMSWSAIEEGEATWWSFGN